MIIYYIIRNHLIMIILSIKHNFLYINITEVFLKRQFLFVHKMFKFFPVSFQNFSPHVTF
jgi:hypothetical protein